MRYDPIKRTIDRYVGSSPSRRRLLYRLLDILLLRSWHVRRALSSAASDMPKSSHVLDAGCGFGQYSWNMARRHKGWHIDAVDIEPSHIESCGEFFERCGLGGRINCTVADILDLNDKERYHLAVIVDVLEHISDDRRVIANLYRSLKPGGRLIISTPSDMGGSDVHSHDESSFIDEHVRYGYNIDELKGMLSAAGFSRVTASYTYGRAGSLSWRISMKYPVMMLNLSKIFFLLLPLYYIVVIMPALVLNLADLYMRNRGGTGLIVTAEK